VPQQAGRSTAAGPAAARPPPSSCRTRKWRASCAYARVQDGLESVELVMDLANGGSEGEAATKKKEDRKRFKRNATKRDAKQQRQL
jgi:hypothetical protein